MNNLARPLAIGCLAVAAYAVIDRGAWVASPDESIGYPMRRHTAQAYGEFDLARLLEEKQVFENGYLGERDERKNNLALICQELGEYQRAETLFREALSEAKGESDRHLIRSNLGRLYQDLGDHAQAEPLLSGYLRSLLETKDARTSSVADALNDLASLHSDMGDFAEAEKLYRRAIALLGAEKYRDDERYSIAVHNLGLLCEKLNLLDEAKKLLTQNVEENKDRLGKRHYAHSLESLAFVSYKKKEFALAETHYLAALKIYEPLLGKENRATARVINNLGFLYAAQGRADQAEPLLKEAVALRKQLFGERHWETADSLSDLAALRDAQNRHAEAATISAEALSIAREKLNLAATVQSERRQMLMAEAFRNQLDLYLSYSSRVAASEESAYAQVLAWKGAVFSRQRWSRLAAAGPEAEASLAELRQLSGRLSVLLDSTPPVEQREQALAVVEGLEQRREELEGRLNAAAATKRTHAPAKSSSDDVRQALPSEAALVDLLYYTHYAGPDGRAKSLVEPRIVAFVVVANRPVVRIELGPALPITEAAEQWRETYGRGSLGNTAAQRLRNQVWVPLEPHIVGAKFVLISPDGALARLPWAALPGSKPQSYLLEEWNTAILPVPQYLPELLRADDDEGQAMPEQRNLLLIGGVDYDADFKTAPAVQVAKKLFGRKPVRSADWKAFGPLEGTVGEIAVIERMYRGYWGGEGLTTLERSAADEDRFYREAPHHRYLHVATHGFFAPEVAPFDAISSTDGAVASRSWAASRAVIRYPGLLSGLALAGANQPPRDDRPDGIVTAEEVQTLNLAGVELATLSACETGLGELAGGEGTLGLQRAFQIAGARSTVAGLWKVDDAQTRALMERFYRNLWDHEMSKLKALHEAQLWMLKEGPKRDLRIKAGAEESRDREGDRSPPYYWAPFVLSGDWR